MSNLLALLLDTPAASLIIQQAQLVLDQERQQRQRFYK